MDPIAAAAVAGLVTGVGLGVVGAIGVTGAIWGTWIALGKWGPAHRRASLGRFPLIRIAVPVLLFSVPAGCAEVFFVPHPQPASAQTVAAVEVPLRTPVDHNDLLAILRHVAGQEGLHVDDGTEEWLQFRRGAPANEPPFARNILTKTIYVGVYRGANDDDMEMDVDDGGHQGRAWITFFRGKRPDLTAKVRFQVMAEIKRKWPDARDVPVMSSGALPLADDLIWNGTTYVVKPDRLAAYGG